MRLWTLHPKYLDARGLCAAWREALLAQAVIRGRTTAYGRHPQLVRFLRSPAPSACINQYLAALYQEARTRGYRFDKRKIGRRGPRRRITATTGQLKYEWRHLRAKLVARDPDWLARLRPAARPDAHPLFVIVDGPVEDWERRGRRR